MTVEAPNTLHAHSPEHASWSSINLAEAVPGVMTPLTASAWVPASELGLRAPFHAMGALPSSRRSIPAEPLERITHAFFGRMAVRVDFLCEMGDLIPGQSGAALSRDFFGFVPPTFQSRPSLRRLPAIIVRYPRTLLGIARRIERLRADTDSWWRRQIARMPALELAEAQVLVREAVERFGTNLAAQAVVSACAIQPLQEQLDNMCGVAGVDPAALLRGSPHEEGVVLDDLWAVSRRALSLEVFLLRHGYHGPGEGEAATRVWREDPTPVLRLIERYADRPDTDGPRATEAQHRRERADAERRLLAGRSVLGRVTARLLLRLARRHLPLRGVGKVSYLQCLDVLRAAARRIGVLLAEQGRIDDGDDVFYLTAEELAEPILTATTTDLRTLVLQRRAQRERYQALDVPTSWTGQPEAVPASGTAARGEDPTDLLAGIGACAGVVEGRAVVVLDPSEAEVDEGDVLVAHTTDPAWVSLMFLSSALVVDIGGLMSHAAVVARELAIPCVMNTGHGTTAIRTGDLVRVDGAAGTVEVLERASSAPSGGGEPDEATA